MMDNNNYQGGNYPNYNGYTPPQAPNPNGVQYVPQQPQAAPVQQPNTAQGRMYPPQQPYRPGPAPGYNNYGAAAPNQVPQGYPNARTPNNAYYPQQTNMPNYGARQYPPQKPKRNSPLLYVLIVILCLCFIAVAALCVYFIMDSDSEQERPERTTPTVTFEDITEDDTVPTETETDTEPSTTEEPETEATEEPTAVATEGDYEYLDDLNRRYGNYFDFRPDENGHVIAHSSDRLISRDELYGMTEHEVCIARNELYARHGYIFQTEKYNEYFKNFSWYRPRTTTLPNLSGIEFQNAQTIIDYESYMGW